MSDGDKCYGEQGEGNKIVGRHSGRAVGSFI